LILVGMFALNPGGDGSGADAGSKSAGKQKLWFFGQLGLYFAVLRGAYVFFASREDKAALKN
jgi:hypothetical protein